LNGARPAVFLDRDGTLNELIAHDGDGRGESPLRLSEVRLLPGAAAAMRSLADAGFALVCVTNQPAAAKGTASREDLEAIHARVLQLLAAGGATFDASRMCLHHPQGVLAGLSGPCDCRKPAPGMLLDAAGELGLALDARSWVVGDTDSDVQAGAAVGCRTILLKNPLSAHKRRGAGRYDLLARDIEDAVAQLLAFRDSY
jgi:histidinol-phosphate phosphatase family protein